MVDDRTISSNGSGVFDDPNRHLIGCGEHRGRPRAWIAEELFRRRVPARDGEVRRVEQRRVGEDAGGFERRLIADPPVSGQVEVALRLPVAADVGDRHMSEGEKVLGCETGERHVVDAQSAHAHQRTADTHDGLTEGEKAGELVWGELERDGDHRIHALAQ